MQAQALADKLSQALHATDPDSLCTMVEGEGIVIRTWKCSAAKGAEYVLLLDGAEVEAFLSSAWLDEALDCGCVLEVLFEGLLKACRWTPCVVKTRFHWRRSEKAHAET